LGFWLLARRHFGHGIKNVSRVRLDKSSYVFQFQVSVGIVPIQFYINASRDHLKRFALARRPFTIRQYADGTGFFYYLAHHYYYQNAEILKPFSSPHAWFPGFIARGPVGN
jgi:hypothetical protein